MTDCTGWIKKSSPQGTKRWTGVARGKWEREGQERGILMGKLSPDHVKECYIGVKCFEQAGATRASNEGRAENSSPNSANTKQRAVCQQGGFRTRE